MEFYVSKEKILEVADRYGLEVDFEKEPGIYVRGNKIEIEDLFDDILID